MRYLIGALLLVMQMSYAYAYPSEKALQILDGYKDECVSGEYRGPMGEDSVKELGIENKKPVFTYDEQVSVNVKLNNNVEAEIIDTQYTYCDGWGIQRLSGRAAWPIYILIGDVGYKFDSYGVHQLFPDKSYENSSLNAMLFWATSAYDCRTDKEQKDIAGFHSCWEVAYWEEDLGRLVFSSSQNNEEKARARFNRDGKK